MPLTLERCVQEDIQSLQELGAKGTLAEITHTDVGNRDQSIEGLATFLIGAGSNEYYAAIGWYWQCSEIPVPTLGPLYKKALGKPTGAAANKVERIDAKTTRNVYVE